jgi:hypothetical protein
MFTCHDGWHVVDHAGGVAYVRVAVRLRDEHGTYVYRVGVVPDDAACGTIWCYGDNGVPWTCAACGEPISAQTYDPLAPTRRRSSETALVEPFLRFVDPDRLLSTRTRRRHAMLAMRAYYARLEQSSVTNHEGGRDGRQADSE